MDFEFPILGYREECEQLPIHFPAQHQPVQPGLETEMNPKPIFDNPDYIGTGKLNNKVALITGGDSGIGRAVSVLFAKEGADIVIVYYNEHEDAELTRSYVEAQGRRCLLLPGNLAEESFCQAIVHQTIQYFGKLDILVNNAAVQFWQDGLENITAQQLYLTYQVNVFPLFFVTKAALPYLKRGSCIISTSSAVAYEGFEYLIDYSSTKGAIVTFTRSMARSLVSKGIRVNGVAPGPIWTPLQVASLPEQNIPVFGTESLMKRAGQPVELAPAYLYLASDDSSYVTGQILHVNGGLVMSS